MPQSFKQEAAVQCRVCKTHKVRFLCSTHNRSSSTKTIDHYRCDICGSVFVGNTVSHEELEIAYSTLETEKYYQEIQLENKKKMTTAISHLETFISKDQSIIDIGTGDGFFIELLHKTGFQNVSAHEIKGSDLSKIKRVANKIFQDYDYSTIPEDNFSVVTLLDVVEHVIDPRYLINVCLRILKKNGVIYFHTPVVTRTDRFMHLLHKIPFLRKVSALWQQGRTSIFHLENYTPQSLTLLLKNAGFHNIKIEVQNELSWPVTRYIKTYLLGKLGLPGFLAPFLLPFFYPFLATNLFNANKAIVSAQKQA